MNMTTRPQFLLELPDDKEVESVEEMRMPDNSGLIRKTVRYRNGMTAIIYQDFQESVFSIHINSGEAPFWISRNQVFKT